jgi:hypothetical protein
MITLRELILAGVFITLAALVWKYIAGPFMRGFIKGFREPEG